MILLGSHAHGDAQAGSDYDFLVIEPTVTSKIEETVGLRDALGQRGSGLDRSRSRSIALCMGPSTRPSHQLLTPFT